MITKVKKITGGVPSLPGDQGLTGQVLTKLSNVAGDYGWADIPQAVVNKINNSGSTNVVQVSESGTDRVDFTVGGALRLRLTADGLSNLTAINGLPIDDYLNPDSAPSLYADMLTAGNYDVDKLWTTEKLEELIDNTVSVPQAAPSGSVTAFAGQTAPSGWLECNGASLRQSSYADLYAAIGENHTEIDSTGLLASLANGTPEPIQAYFLDGSTAYAGYVDAGTPDLLYIRSMDDEHSVTNWTTQILSDSPGNSAEIRFIKVANSEVYVGAVAEDAPYSLDNLYVTVLNASTGAIERTFTIPDYGSSFSLAGKNTTVGIDSSGNLYLHRVVSSNPAISKYGPTGVLSWTYELSTDSIDSYDIPNFLFVDESGGFIYAAQQNGGNDTRVLKINSTTGALVWFSSAYVNTGLVGMVLLPNGNIFTCGTTTGGNDSRYVTIDSSTGSTISSEVKSYVEDASEPGSVSYSNSDAIVKDPVTDEVYVVERYAGGGIFEYFSATVLTFSGNSVDTSRTFATSSNTFNKFGGEPFLDADGGLRVPDLLSGGTIVRVYMDGFGIPDLRGEFVRGLDSGRGVDSGRSLGSFQDGEVGPHTHPAKDGDPDAVFVTERTSNEDGVGGYSGSGNDLRENTGTNSGNETRPRNIALMYIIKT